MMWYWGEGVHWWGWLLGTVAMVAFWALLVWAIWYVVAAVRRPENRSPESHGPGDPKRILDERLARGEIDAEEYRRLRSVMREGDTHVPGEEHAA